MTHGNIGLHVYTHAVSINSPHAGEFDRVDLIFLVKFVDVLTSLIALKRWTCSAYKIVLRALADTGRGANQFWVELVQLFCLMVIDKLHEVEGGRLDRERSKDGANVLSQGKWIPPFLQSRKVLIFSSASICARYRTRTTCALKLELRIC